MLPDRLDTFEPAAVDCRGDAGDEPAWVRGAGGEPRVRRAGEAARPRDGESRLRAQDQPYECGGAVRKAAEHRDDAVAHPLAEAAREAVPRAIELRLVVEDVRPRGPRVGKAGRADETDEGDEDRRQPDERLSLEKADQGEQRVAAEVERAAKIRLRSENVSVWSPAGAVRTSISTITAAPRTVATTDWRPRPPSRRPRDGRRARTRRARAPPAAERDRGEIDDRRVV